MRDGPDWLYTDKIHIYAQLLYGAQRYVNTQVSLTLASPQMTRLVWLSYCSHRWPPVKYVQWPIAELKDCSHLVLLEVKDSMILAE